MARKKRKAIPSAPAAPAAMESARAERMILPALGALALILAWLALLGGFSDRTLDWRDIFHLDPMRMVLMFNDWSEGKFPLDGWRKGAIGLALPDYILTWAPLLAGMDFRAVYYLFPMLHVAFAAAGWVVLCDFLFGKSPRRRAAVLLLNALPLLLMAWRGGDLFMTLLSPHTHSAAWTPMPWLLWVLLRALQEGRAAKGKAPPVPWPWLAALFALTAANAADGITLSWFVAPVVFAALSLVWRGDVSIRVAGRVSAAVVAGFYVGREITWLFNPIIEGNVSARLELDPAAMLNALGALREWAAFMLSRNPLEGAVWLAFAAVAVWRMLAVFLPALRRKLPEFMDLPPGPAHAFLALFVPASAAAGLASVIIAGYFAFGGYYSDGMLSPSISHRLLMPMMFFPLFSGWALLPWSRGVFLLRLRPTTALAAAMLAVAGFSAAKAVSIRTAALDPLATPFQQCFAENARRLGWKAGISTVDFGQILTAHPAAGVERMMHVGVYRAKDAHGGQLPANPHPGANGRSVMTIENNAANGHENSGEFQFAMTRFFRGRVFTLPPRAGDEGCPTADPGAACNPVQYSGGRGMVDEEAYRGALGDPKEVIECAGIGLLHYDPPLKFDFSGRDSHGALVGIW